ncbi:MAG: hypothetical protein L7S56_05520 [Candidatus Poseidonia sp.]|nr:hypothetical protein [Poseidonia sp.]
MLSIGLAMLQGARHEHAEALRGAARELGIDLEIVPCRTASDVVDDLDGLVLPGGESTTMRIASRYESLLNALFDWMERHPQRPVLGTCAGAILMANPEDGRTRFLNVSIDRNAWGRQRQSFEAEVTVMLETPISSKIPVAVASRGASTHHPLEVHSQAAPLLDTGYPGVFIRAPRFDASDLQCTPIAMLGEEVVGVLDGSRLGLTFHPELTLDRRFHRWLLSEATLRGE